MRIAIVGPGAIGSLLAALLSRGGREVWLLDHHPDRARLIAARGITVSGVSGEFKASVPATAEPGEIGRAGLVAIMVKSYDTARAARAARPLVGPETMVLTLQNGLGNIEAIAGALGEERAGSIIGGVTAQGATLLAPGRVRHAGRGATIIGEPSGGPTPRVRELAALLSGGGIETEVTGNLLGVLWRKLAVNSGVNAVAALAGVTNGALLASAHLWGLALAAADEAAAVARAQGVELPGGDIGEQAQEVCCRTAGNVNSMLQDVRRGRRTEVDAINGAVVREGEAAGVATPVNRVLAALIAGIEDTACGTADEPGKSQAGQHHKR